MDNVNRMKKWKQNKQKNIPLSYGFNCTCFIIFRVKPRYSLLIDTRDAPSKRSLRLLPISRNDGKRIQHVCNVLNNNNNNNKIDFELKWIDKKKTIKKTYHDPLIPWHLHSRLISFDTCYFDGQIKTNNKQTKRMNEWWISIKNLNKMKKKFDPESIKSIELIDESISFAANCQSIKNFAYVFFSLTVIYH